MLIGIAGPKGSGKDTLASLLKEEYPLDLLEVRAFALPLKNFICDIFNLDERHNSGHLKETEVNIIMPTVGHIASSVDYHLGLEINKKEGMKLACLIIKYLKQTCCNSEFTIFSSYRTLMQHIGTDIIRTCFGNDIWINLHSKNCSNRPTIVPDVRFENEASYIRHNGILIRLVGRGEVDNPEHISEIPVATNNKDILIDNSGLIHTLRTSVKDLLKPHITNYDVCSILGDFR